MHKWRRDKDSIAIQVFREYGGGNGREINERSRDRLIFFHKVWVV